MDSKNTWIIILVVVIGSFCLNGGKTGSKTNNKCRSHDNFSFLCHHNDTNTDIYLRRIDDKLEKIFKQIDRTPENIKTKTEIKENAAYSSGIISPMLKQLALLRSGKVITGFWANFIPYFLCDYANRDFDFQTDVIVALFTETKNYTQEEAWLRRKTLPERSEGAEVSESCALRNIEGNLQNIIEDVLMEAVLKAHNHKTPIDLPYLIESKRDHAKEDAVISKAMEAVKEGKISSFRSLENFLREKLQLS